MKPGIVDAGLRAAIDAHHDATARKKKEPCRQAGLLSATVNIGLANGLARPESMRQVSTNGN
jgi:hypothetical protein